MILTTIARVLSAAVDLYSIILVVYVLLSWFPHATGFLHTLYEFLGKLCEPYLGLFRKVIPPLGGIDISPILAIIVLELAARIVLRILYFF